MSGEDAKSYPAGIRKDEDEHEDAVVCCENEGDTFYPAGILKDEDEDGDAVVFCENEGPTFYPSRILRDKDAAVFWDAQDYPISGVDHESVFRKIKETLSDCPKVSIHAYVNNLSDELRHKYEDAQITIHDLSTGEKANWQILVDIYMLVMRCDDRSNLIVLSKQFTEVTMICRLTALHRMGYGVFFSETGSEYGGRLPSNSFLTSLFTKKRGREADTPTDLTLKSTSMSNSLDNSFQSMTGDFPSMPNSSYRATYVYLVMDDLSILENGEDVLELRKKLDKALRKKGYRGRKEYWGHFINKDTRKHDDEFNHNYDHYGLERVQYNKGAGFDKVLAEIFLMVARIQKSEYLNLVILSDNEKFPQGARRFAEVCRFLGKNRLFNVVVAQLDQLLKVADESGMEEDNYVDQLPPP